MINKKKKKNRHWHKKHEGQFKAIDCLGGHDQ